MTSMVPRWSVELRRQLGSIVADAAGELTVFCGTFNTHHQPPPTSLELREWILPCDIIAVGAQELGNFTKVTAMLMPWLGKGEWVQALGDAIGPGYTLLDARPLGPLHLAVFVRTSVRHRIRFFQTASVRCGLGNVLNNKGGIGLALLFESTSILFVTCHLNAHQGNASRRDADFTRLQNGLAGKLAKATGCSADFDHIFWFGDVNYRLNLSYEDCLQKLGTDSANRRLDDDLRQELLVHDQLASSIDHKSAFNGFEEGEITFLPTYKLDKNDHESYDRSKKRRVPSYTDRVLHRGTHPDSCRIIQYEACLSIQCSDHRPVAAIYAIRYDTSDADWEFDALKPLMVKPQISTE